MSNPPISPKKLFEQSAFFEQKLSMFLYRKCLDTTSLDPIMVNECQSSRLFSGCCSMTATTHNKNERLENGNHGRGQVERDR